MCSQIYSNVIHVFTLFMKAVFSQVRHPSHPGRGHASPNCHMTEFEQSDWLRSENFINIMIEWVITPHIKQWNKIVSPCRNHSVTFMNPTPEPHMTITQGRIGPFTSFLGVAVISFSILKSSLFIFPIASASFLFWSKDKSLWLSDAIWRHGYGSTLAQVIACCLTAPNHYLNKCWLIIVKVPWH